MGTAQSKLQKVFLAILTQTKQVNLSSEKDTILQEVKERIEDLEVEHDMILGSELENHRGISPSNLIGATFEKAGKFINPTTVKIKAVKKFLVFMRVNKSGGNIPFSICSH